MNIGLFGGSFNPIHIGHAIIANHIVQFSGIDQLWFMVAPQNPLKAKTHEVSDSDRLRMVEFVSRRLDKAITSAFEFGLLIVILLVKPTGLLGKKIREKV